MATLAYASGFAATYYVTPEGAGSKDGSSWDNAFGVDEFRAQAAENANGDVYYFDGGLYNLSESTVAFKTGTGATLIGNADGARTIFSGDKDGNGTPNTDDLNLLIRFQANTVDGNSANKIVIENLDFTCAYTNVASATASNPAALVIDNSGDVEVRGCRFYKNEAVGSMGGAAAFLARCTVKFENCVFSDNLGASRGGAVRIWSDNANKGKITFDGCVFKNNATTGAMGGAIFMGHGHSLNIVNSTLYGNKAASDGSAIYHNGYSSAHHCELRIVNSTFASNLTTDADDAQIVSTQSAHTNIANSIVSGDEQTGALKFKGDAANDAFSFISGGYNYIGAINDAVGNELAWLDTDVHGSDCTYSAIFGENTLTADNVVIPSTFYLGATGQQVTEAVAEWGLPEGLDLNVDQLGNDRSGQVTMGAYASPKDATSGIDAVLGTEAPALISLGASTYAVAGYEGPVRVYALDGSLVLTSGADDINISNLINGIYILQAGNATFKVIR